MAQPLLDARGLEKRFPVGSGRETRYVHAVAGVDVAIAEGETHGLVGESGSGKSTTGRLLLRLIEPDAGTAMFNGTDLFALQGAELRQMRRRIQLIYQDPFSSVDPRYRARDIVAEPWVTHRMYDRAERRQRADALLERVGLDPSHGDRRPPSFSGGQLQRIGIARALALEPDLVICDEPVSALDVSVQGQIINLLTDLQAELDVSYLFIAHDLAVVRHISDRVSVMYLGRIVETGTREDVFERAAHPYTQALLAAMDDRRPEAMAGRLVPGDPPRPTEPPSGCAFRTRCPKAQARCADEAPALVERGQGHPVACHFAELEAGRGVPLSTHTRIEGDDGHVREQVDQRHEQSGDDAHAHDQGGIEPA
jgi:oligopeptide/dipeptide ABC transporter ATP-binding protein